jgi:hypothetical protein
MAWPLLPLGWQPGRQTFRHPLLEHGLLEASCAARVVEAWFKRWPAMLIGTRTGCAPLGAGICVLDVDIKPGKIGNLTMRALGYADPPRTPMVVTQSGGRHLYFRSPAAGFGNTQGEKGRGIGKDVDWRGNNGYVVAPGGVWVRYRWHSQCNLDTCPILPIPAALLPRAPPPAAAEPTGPAARVRHADAYVEAMLARGDRDIAGAGDGEQHFALNGVAFNFGRTSARRNLDRGPLIRALVEAGCRMRAYRPHEPWVRDEVERTVRDGFEAGVAKEGR